MQKESFNISSCFIMDQIIFTVDIFCALFLIPRKYHIMLEFVVVMVNPAGFILALLQFSSRFAIGQQQIDSKMSEARFLNILGTSQARAKHELYFISSCPECLKNALLVHRKKIWAGNACRQRDTKIAVQPWRKTFLAPNNSRLLAQKSREENFKFCLSVSSL